MTKHPLRVPAAVLALLVSACGGGTGSASINDTIPGTVMSLQTVFGWITTVSGLDGGAWEPLKPQPLIIIASGASVDATSDLRFDSASQLLQAGLDQTKGGQVTLGISDVSKLVVGQAFTFSNPDQGDACSFQFGLTPIQNGPAIPVPLVLGSDTQCALTLTQIGTVEGQSFSGTLTITVTRGSGDPMNAVTGSVVVTLSGPLVNQFLGPCDVEALGLASSNGLGSACPSSSGDSTTSTVGPGVGGSF